MTRFVPLLSLFLAMFAAPTASAAVIDYSGTVVRADFDGDGLIDSAVSSPQNDCERGVVYVSTANGVSSLLRGTGGVLGTSNCYDRFGASLAAGDIDGDGYDDLVVGVPGARDSGLAYAGAVHVLYGSSGGISTVGDQVWHQGTVGVQGVPEVGDYFGDRVTMGDFDCNGYMDVAIGVPREAVGSVSDAGAVNVLYGRSTGLTSVDDIWHQGTGGVNGTSETGDYFGASLASGNFNGDTLGGRDCDDLAIGAPLENWGSVVNAGTVYIIDGGATGLETVGDQLLHQNIGGVDDTLEAYDNFAEHLEVVNLDGDEFADLAVTVPGDVCDPQVGLGRHLFHGASGGLSTVNDSISCDTFGCDIDAGGYACLYRTRNVRGSGAAEQMRLSQNDDVVWAGAGDDDVAAGIGRDILFGSSGHDNLSGGAGMDIQIGGYGDDTFVLDRDCQLGVGEVVDGGPGTDTVRSHLKQAQILATGTILNSIEVFELVPEGDEPCDPFPFIGVGLREPDVDLSWQQLLESDSVTTTQSGLLQLRVENQTARSLEITLELTLSVSGVTLEHEVGPETVGTSTPRVLRVDLNDFIPVGLDPASVPASLLQIPVSASLRTRAVVRHNSKIVDAPSAPVLFGHIDTDGLTVVLYREEALRNTYYGGALGLYRRNLTGGGNSYFRSVVEAR